MGARFTRSGLLGRTIGERDTVPPPPKILCDGMVMGISYLARWDLVRLLIIVRTWEARE